MPLLDAQTSPSGSDTTLSTLSTPATPATIKPSPAPECTTSCAATLPSRTHLTLHRRNNILIHLLILVITSPAVRELQLTATTTFGNILALESSNVSAHP